MELKNQSSCFNSTCKTLLHLLNSVLNLLLHDLKTLPPSTLVPLAKGPRVALLEGEVQRQPRNPPGRRQQSDDRRLRQPRHLRQPGGHGRHPHILPQSIAAPRGLGAQERADAELKPDEDYAAEPGGRGALRGR